MLKQNSPTPLAEISPSFWGTSEGDTGPNLRLRVAAGWDHLKRVLRWLDDSLLGDFLALICLIILTVGGIIIAGAFS